MVGHGRGRVIEPKTKKPRFFYLHGDPQTLSSTSRPEMMEGRIMLMLNLIPVQALKVRAGALRLSAPGLRTVEGNPGQKAETLFSPEPKAFAGLARSGSPVPRSLRLLSKRLWVSFGSSKGPQQLIRVQALKTSCA